MRNSSLDTMASDLRNCVEMLSETQEKLSAFDAFKQELIKSQLKAVADELETRMQGV